MKTGNTCHIPCCRSLGRKHQLDDAHVGEETISSTHAKHEVVQPSQMRTYSAFKIDVHWLSTNLPTSLWVPGNYLFSLWCIHPVWPWFESPGRVELTHLKVKCGFREVNTLTWAAQLFTDIPAQLASIMSKRTMSDLKWGPSASVVTEATSLHTGLSCCIHNKMVDGRSSTHVCQTWSTNSWECQPEMWNSRR